MPTYILPISVEKKPSFRTDDRIFIGEGLFETIRVDEGRPCYPYLHWQRMRLAAMSLGIPFDVSSQKWHEQLLRCIQVANIQMGGVKVLLSGGSALRGLNERGCTSSILFEAFTYLRCQKAWRLVSAPWFRDAKNPIYQFKSVNYLEAILARRQALACGADDALFYNVEQCVTETTIANVFIIKQHQLLTPTLDNGVLAGVIRGRLLRLCEDRGIHCTEASIDKKTLREADAVFVTNALQGIILIKSVDGCSMPVQHPSLRLLQQMLATDQTRWD